MKRKPAIRDVVMFFYEEKDRTGVVLDFNESARAAIVVYGTRTFREQVNVGLRCGTPTCNALKLTETTYFYPEHIVMVDLELLRLKANANCLFGLIQELRRLYKHAVLPLKYVRKQPLEEIDIFG